MKQVELANVTANSNLLLITTSIDKMKESEKESSYLDVLGSLEM